MLKKITVTLLSATILLMSGCGSTGDSIPTSTVGPSSGSGDSNGLGGLSGNEDIAAFLEESAWTSITMDLDKFLFDTTGKTSDYDIQMTFKDGVVTALADCNIVTASYKINDNEMTFYRVSAPKPAIDYPTCQEFQDAENAVSSFFSSDYFVSANKQTEVSLESMEIDASVVLTR